MDRRRENEIEYIFGNGSLFRRDDACMYSACITKGSPFRIEFKSRRFVK